MGHWEVALQCLSFPSRPGPGGGLVEMCGAGNLMDSGEVFGSVTVRVSCLRLGFC